LRNAPLIAWKKRSTPPKPRRPHNESKIVGNLYHSINTDDADLKLNGRSLFVLPRKLPEL
jgi:hypothetical protein